MRACLTFQNLIARIASFALPTKTAMCAFVTTISENQHESIYGRGKTSSSSFDLYMLYVSPPNEYLIPPTSISAPPT